MSEPFSRGHQDISRSSGPGDFSNASVGSEGTQIKLTTNDRTMQDDTLSSIDAFEILDAESLSEYTRKTMLASEEKTTRAYLECRLSELRVRKGRMERAVTKMHVLMIDGLMKDVDDFKNRVQYDHRIGDFRQYILEQCARFQWDLQELKHELLAKLRENSNEIKELEVANQNVTTTNAYPLEANVDPHDANADPCNLNDDPYDANVDSHDANAERCKANGDPHEANIDTHKPNDDPQEANTDTHKANDDPYEANTDTHKANDDPHEANTDTHKPNDDPYEANTDTHKANDDPHEANTDTHKPNDDPHEANTDTHKSNDDPHEANTDTHKANDDPHEANTDTHKANDDPHEANTDTHKANDDPCKANADTHEANTNTSEANANRHETNDDRHETDTERHKINAEQLQVSAEQHEANTDRHKARTDPHDVTADTHEATAELHEDNAELQKTSAERHEANAEPHETKAERLKAIGNLHEANAELHETNAELHETNAELHETNAERLKSIGNPHEANAELYEANAKKHEANAELHAARAERHKTNAESYEANAERHKANIERHKANAVRHQANVERHKANVERHKANVERHKANVEQYVASADQHKAKTNPYEANANPHMANAKSNETNASLNEAHAATQDTNVASTRGQEVNKPPCQVRGLIPMKSPESGERVHELHKTSRASKSNPIGNNQELQPSNGEQPEPAARDARKASQELAVSNQVDRNQSQEATNIQVTQEGLTRTQGVNHEVDATRNQATSTKEVTSWIHATNYTQQADSCVSISHQTSKMTLDSPTCNVSTAEGIEISKSRPEGKADANATTADDGYFQEDSKDLPATADRSSIDLLLIGNCGNGKSATGNSILGKPAFRRNASFSVDSESSAPTIMMDSTNVAGKVVNVIDGHSLNVFGNITPEELEKTIKNIHESLELCEFAFTAVLIALKFGNRFTKQEVDAIRVIKNVLGKDVIRDYGVCVITFGDAFDHYVEESREDGEKVTFESWLHSQSGEVAKLFEECDYRCVLFDNVTKDANKRLAQLNKLMEVLPQGKRFSQEAFLQAWEGTHGLELEANLPVFLIEAQKEADIIAEMICHAEETKRLDPEAHKIKSKLSELKEKVYAMRTKSSELERLQLFVLQLETELNMKINQWRIEREMYRNAGVPYAQSEAAMLANKARKDVGNASHESRFGGFKEDMSEMAVFANSRSKNHSGFPKDSHAFSRSSPMYSERETTQWYEDTHHDSSVDTFGFVMVKNEKAPGASHESRYDVIKRRVRGFFKGIGLVSSAPTHQTGGQALIFPSRQF